MTCILVTVDTPMNSVRRMIVIICNGLNDEDLSVRSAVSHPCVEKRKDGAPSYCDGFKGRPPAYRRVFSAG